MSTEVRDRPVMTGPSARDADLEERDRTLLLVALTVGIYWVVGTANYQHLQPATLVLLLLGALAGLLVLRRHREGAWGVLGYVTLIGLVNRAGRTAFNGSDVIGATREAIVVVAHGGNPYAHTYVLTNPAGAPFPYLPGEIAFYAIPHVIVGQIVGADKWAGVGVVLLLAALAIATGPAPAALGTILYATFEPAVLRSLDGSNDTGLAFLVLLAILLLAVSERLHSRTLFYASAIVFAWALVFKEFAWLIYPFIVASIRGTRAGWKSYAVVSSGLAVCTVLPFFLAAPAGFIHNIVSGLSYHQQPFGLDLWASLRGAPELGRFLPLAPLFVAGAVLVAGAIFIFHPVTNLGIALLQGLTVLFTALFFARYATSSYYTFACALLAAALILFASRPSRLLAEPKTESGRSLGG